MQEHRGGQQEIPGQVEEQKSIFGIKKYLEKIKSVQFTIWQEYNNDTFNLQALINWQIRTPTSIAFTVQTALRT